MTCTTSSPDHPLGVEWLGQATPNAGQPYVNEGAHIIRIRRGRVVYFHAYEDSQQVADACRRMAAPASRKPPLRFAA
jgi:ketosteroid isomerase-like protein